MFGTTGWFHFFIRFPQIHCNFISGFSIQLYRVIHLISLNLTECSNWLSCWVYLFLGKERDDLCKFIPHRNFDFFLKPYSDVEYVCRNIKNSDSRIELKVTLIISQIKIINTSGYQPGLYIFICDWEGLRWFNLNIQPRENHYKEISYKIEMLGQIMDTFEELDGKWRARHVGYRNLHGRIDTWL